MFELLATVFKLLKDLSFLGVGSSDYKIVLTEQKLTKRHIFTFQEENCCQLFRKRTIFHAKCHFFPEILRN